MKNKKKIIKKMSRDQKWLDEDIQTDVQELQMLENIKNNINLQLVKNNRNDTYLKIKFNEVMGDIQNRERQLTKKRNELKKIKNIKNKLKNNFEFFPDEMEFLKNNYE